MQIILQGNGTINKLLGKQEVKKDVSYRPISYLLFEVINNYVLAYNFLTKEMLMLTLDEYELFKQKEYTAKMQSLIEKWFIVPDKFDEFNLFNQISVLMKMSLKKEYKDFYLIFTTTECNARCFYCFEGGRKQLKMTSETAQQVVKYIVKESKGNNITLQWFGGEPLYNSEVIDIITDGLKNAGIKFKSGMITNGYLFDKNAIFKAKHNWNLKNVQITLDGTKDIYNKVKNYIYKDEINAFQRVYDNIGFLLENGISVCVRYNIDAYNEQDLYKLTDQLACSYGGYDNFSIKAQMIFENDNGNKNSHSSDLAQKYRIRDNMLNYLEKKNILNVRMLKNEFSINRCMSDSDSSTTILPDGSLGKCEHYSDSETYGSIFSEDIDSEKIMSFKKRLPILEKCKSCPIYPDCIELEKCPSFGIDFLDSKQCKFKIDSFKRSMRKFFNRHQSGDGSPIEYSTGDSSVS